jgi:hypothetical protein
MFSFCFGSIFPEDEEVSEQTKENEKRLRRSILHSIGNP